MHKRTLCLLSLNLITFCASTYAGSMGELGQNSVNVLTSGKVAVALGGYWRTQPHNQLINIDGLIGDQFTVTGGSNSNGLFGVGYFIDGQTYQHFNTSFGVNWFYLPPTSVSGTVYQEKLYPNLSYGYKVANYPLYLVAKSESQIPKLNRDVTVNVGIGPNFMKTSAFGEQGNPIADSVATIPDQIFSGKTITNFSVTAGLGFKLNDFFGKKPLECGYQFYYLGQGNFNVLNTQVQNTLSTGTLYANAVLCSVMI